MTTDDTAPVAQGGEREMKEDSSTAVAVPFDPARSSPAVAAVERVAMAICNWHDCPPSEFAMMTSVEREMALSRGRAAVEACCQFLEEYSRDHACTIEHGKHVSPDAKTLTRWCRAYLSIAIEDLRKEAGGSHEPRLSPESEVARAVPPTPDSAVMRDYIDKLTRFYIANAKWVALAEEARGYIGALGGVLTMKPAPVDEVEEQGLAVTSEGTP